MPQPGEVARTPKTAPEQGDQRNLLITNTTYLSGTGWTTVAEFSYDGDGNRVQQVDYTGASPITTTYHNDNLGLSQVLISNDGSVQTAMLYGLDLIHQDNGTETRTLLADGLGSARTEVVGGAIETVTTYEPYGKVLAQTGESGTVYGYTGERFDAATGLVYLRARYYNPNLKTFLTRDPFPGWMGLSASQHPYSYAHNSPVNHTDPSGNCILLAGIDTALCVGLIFAGVTIGTAIYYTAIAPSFSVPVKLPPISAPTSDDWWLFPGKQIREICEYYAPSSPTTAMEEEDLSLFEEHVNSLSDSGSNPNPDPESEPEKDKTKECCPVDDDNHIYLYHYTDAEHYSSIMSSGKVLAGQGIYGPGVYLTDVSPSEASKHRRGDLAEFLFANYQDKRVDYWVKVDVTGLIVDTRIIFNVNDKFDPPYGEPYLRRSYHIARSDSVKVIIGGKITFTGR